MIQIGIIGTDSTHAIEFTRLLNAETSSSARIIGACVGHETDFPLSLSRREQIGRTLHEELKLPLFSSIQELLGRVDAVMVLSCDGRCHRREILSLLSARKPIFVDKPFCADWREAAEVLQVARPSGTPCFSTSALRYSAGVESAKELLRNRPAKIECSVPQRSEPGHPDLSWHGIHGVEAAYALMGAGCQTVQRRIAGSEDVTMGVWGDGSEVMIRRATNDASAEFRTTVTVAGSEKIIRGHSYHGLLKAIVKFFETGKSPVAEKEMLEVLAFIAAADESRDTHGASIDLPQMLVNLAL
jgi:Oxidoreductase family, NAD-binding Rossmann fold